MSEHAEIEFICVECGHSHYKLCEIAGRSNIGMFPLFRVQEDFLCNRCNMITQHTYKLPYPGTVQTIGAAQ